MFILWSISNPSNPQQIAWREWYESQEPSLSPRVLRLIGNLSLLHKSRAEAEFDRMQRMIQEAGQENEHSHVTDHSLDPLLGGSDDEMYDENGEVGIDQEWDKESVLGLAHRIDNRLYTMEGIDSSWDFGYLRHEHEHNTEMCLDRVPTGN
jgi:hypothetical protein